jgi:hypothetical protein
MNVIHMYITISNQPRLLNHALYLEMAAQFDIHLRNNAIKCKYLFLSLFADLYLAENLHLYGRDCI